MAAALKTDSRAPRLSKYGGSARDLAAMVMSRMRDDEPKLTQHLKKLIKEHRTHTIQIFTTEIGGWTPVHACALRGSKKLLKVFLNSGVDVNIQMGQPEGLPSRCSLLHLVCLRGDIELIKLLLSKGADIESVDSYNRTPVAYAAQRKHKRAVQFLESRGANMAAVAGSLIWDECITPLSANGKFCFF